MSRPTITKLRCMRCVKEAELTPTDDPKDAGMLKIGQNLHYCFTCAKLTGHPEAPGAAQASKRGAAAGSTWSSPAAVKRVGCKKAVTSNG